MPVMQRGRLRRDGTSERPRWAAFLSVHQLSNAMNCGTLWRKVVVSSHLQQRCLTKASPPPPPLPPGLCSQSFQAAGKGARAPRGRGPHWQKRLQDGLKWVQGRLRGTALLQGAVEKARAERAGAGHGDGGDSGAESGPSGAASSPRVSGTGAAADAGPSGARVGLEWASPNKVSFPASGQGPPAALDLSHTADRGGADAVAWREDPGPLSTAPRTEVRLGGLPFCGE